MKASLKLLALGLFLLAPFSTAQAQAPLLSPIANVTVNAGSMIKLDVVAVDPANRPIMISADLPPFAMLNMPVFGTGEVLTSVWVSPSIMQAGDYTAAVTAEAGGASSVTVFQITVNPLGTNLAPQVTAPPLKEVTEGANLNFDVTAVDADGDPITSLTASGLPLGATFTANGTNTTGTFDWTPVAGDAGEYDVMFTASNDQSGTATTHIRVAAAPTLAVTPIDDQTVPDGTSISVPVHASGVPGALITLTAALPTFATLEPPGTGTGVVNTTIMVSPPTGSAGTYHASVTATSLGQSLTEPFDIIVTGSGGSENHAPVLTAPASKTVDVGSNLSFSVTAIDPDGDHVDLSGTALPPGSNFIDNGNNTGTFSWTPAGNQVGSHTASFTGLDGRGGSGSASTSITVNGGAPPQNHAPVLDAPATKVVDEGANLSFTVTATDQDGDHVALTAEFVPAGATFSDQGDNTGVFSWTPGSTQSGDYDVVFAGNDGNGGTGTATTHITVNDVTGGGGGGGGGGGEVPGKACLIASFSAHWDETCFRIRPVNNSFDLRDVDLSSITLHFRGASIAALGAAIDVPCRRGDDEGGDRGKTGRAAVALINLNGDHGEDGGDDHDGCGGIVCGNHGDNHGRGDHGGTCDTLGIRACFSTQAFRAMLQGAKLPCALVNAEIHANLKSGGTVVATFGHGEGDDGDRGNQGNDGKRGRAGLLSANVRPNPLNPMTELSFTMSREGRVRVMIYDMQGRRVKMLLDEVRSAGRQTLEWDGSNTWNQRVASGVYFLRIEAPEGAAIQRVAVVK
jgi:putative Ig domain-containing protein/Big-like domain-containing protein